MSKNIIHLNPEAIHTELKDLVKNSIEETLMLIAIRSSTWKSERWNLILPKNGMEVNSSEKVL